MKCDNADVACQWIGELRSLRDHKAICEYTFTVCPHRGCNQQVIKKNLEAHIKDQCLKRDYRCPHCDQEGKYASIVGLHLDKCLYVPIQCPNEGCDEEISCSLITFHMSTECEFKFVECKYRAIGCNVKVMRKDLEKHEKNLEIHFHNAMFSIRDLRQELRDVKSQTVSLPLKDLSQQERSSLQSANSELQESLKAMQAEIKELKDKFQTKRTEVFSSITFKVADILQDYTPGTCCVTSPFYTSETGYKLRVCVYPNVHASNYVKVQLYLMPGEFDDKLDWPYAGTVKIELLNQKADSNHHCQMIKCSREAGSYASL